MAEKNTDVVIGEQHRVHLDPQHGLRLPDATELAAKGVVTNGQRTVGGGEKVSASEEDVQALRDAGVAS